VKKKFKNNYTFENVQGLKTINQLANVLAVTPAQLKKLQKRIIDRILKLYPLTDITYGAVDGMSTKLNAQNHVRKRVVVRIDLTDCFHSIKSEWVYRCFRKQFGYSKSVAKILTRISTYNGSIPVGSPLSSMPG